MTGSFRRSARLEVLVLAATLAASGCSRAGDPGDAASAFVSEVAKGRQAEALERVDPQLRQIGGMMLGMGLAEGTARAKRNGGLKEVRVLRSERTDDTHAVVTTETFYNDGSSRRDTGKLRLFEGTWFVTM